MRREIDPGPTQTCGLVRRRVTGNIPLRASPLKGGRSMKKLWLPLTSVILSMLPAVLLFAQLLGGTPDNRSDWIKARKSSNSRQQKLELARKGSSTGAKSTAKSTTGNV